MTVKELYNSTKDKKIKYLLKILAKVNWRDSECNNLPI